MKIAVRLVLLAAVAALGFWLWTVLFPGPEPLIRRRIASLAASASVNANDSNVTRALKVGKLIEAFAVAAEINFDVPEVGIHTLLGRDEIRDAARSVMVGLQALKVEFLDVTVRLGVDRRTANVSCTARVHAGDNKEYGVQEMRFQFAKTDGAWLITRAETVKTLQ